MKKVILIVPFVLCGVVLASEFAALQIAEDGAPESLKRNGQCLDLGPRAMRQTSFQKASLRTAASEENMFFSNYSLLTSDNLHLLQNNRYRWSEIRVAQGAVPLSMAAYLVNHMSVQDSRISKASMCLGVTGLVAWYLLRYQKAFLKDLPGSIYKLREDMAKGFSLDNQYIVNGWVAVMDVKETFAKDSQEFATICEALEKRRLEATAAQSGKGASAVAVGQSGGMVYQMYIRDQPLPDDLLQGCSLDEAAEMAAQAERAVADTSSNQLVANLE